MYLSLDILLMGGMREGRIERRGARHRRGGGVAAAAGGHDDLRARLALRLHRALQLPLGHGQLLTHSQINHFVSRRTKRANEETSKPANLPELTSERAERRRKG